MTTFSWASRVAVISLLLNAIIAPSIAQEAGRTLQSPPELQPDVAARLRAFTVRRGLLRVTKVTQFNRAALKSNAMSFAAATQNGGIKITGQRAIPVLLAKYSDTQDDPFLPANLQQELFGKWPSGTMSDYYREISYGAFTVTGTVRPWVKLPLKAADYEGPDLKPTLPIDPIEHCHALCPQGKMVQFINDTLRAQDADTDFTQFDNDGPDGIPNSGDDDGFVDFVAFVQPHRGGECDDNPNIWSHRFSLSDWSAVPFETNDVGKSGRKILIDDYVVMPALACDNHTMIQIGVFAHEFGHAFGLPDLYDANGKEDGISSGIGNWGLMGSGSWGGDGDTPSRPSHMSAWEKEYLGWVRPQIVKTDQLGISLAAVENTPQVLKVLISDEEYYLIENRTKTGFDNSLTGSGLLIWKVNSTIIGAGLRSNSVNGDPGRLGLKLMEADGLSELEHSTNRGNAGDQFRGSANKVSFDSRSAPPSWGQIAVCRIGPPGATNLLDVIMTRSTC